MQRPALPRPPITRVTVTNDTCSSPATAAMASALGTLGVPRPHALRAARRSLLFRPFSSVGSFVCRCVSFAFSSPLFISLHSAAPALVADLTFSLCPSAILLFASSFVRCSRDRWISTALGSSMSHLHYSLSNFFI